MAKSISTKDVMLIDAKALADILSTSVRTVWRLRTSGKLPKPITIGGSVRWSLHSIERWIEMGAPPVNEFEARNKG